MPNLITKIRFFFYIRRRLLRCRKKQLTIAGLQIILFVLSSLIMLFQNNNIVYTILFFCYAVCATIQFVEIFEERGIVYSVCQSFVLLFLSYTVGNHSSRLFFAIPLYVIGLLIIIRRRDKLFDMYMDYRFRDVVMRDIYFTSSLYNEKPSGKRTFEVLLRRYTVFACLILFGIMLIPSLPQRPVPWEKGFEKNVDTFLLFHEDVWEKLTDEERLAAMQCAANVQNAAFGLPEVPVVEEKSLIIPKLGAAYYREPEIRIYSQNFSANTGTEALEVIYHECRHLYQASVCFGGRILDCYPVDADTIKIWKYEFENYINCDVDEDGYSNQLIEIDADLFGETQTKLIIEKIYDAYLDCE